MISQKLQEHWQFHWRRCHLQLYLNRCYLNNVGYDGTKCCSGDCFLIAINGQETVVKIETLLSLNCGDDLWKLLGKGYLYSFHQDAHGQISHNYWTGFTKVEKFLGNEVTFFQVRTSCENSPE